MLAVYASSMDPKDPIAGLEIGERPEPEVPDGWTTVTVKAASLNYHEDHFSSVFAVRTADGAMAHTACVGVGLERTALALYRRHGLDRDRWPAAVRQELGLSAEGSQRFSWGYAACPDLHEQHKVLPLLHAVDDIGLSLSLSDNLDPEHSTAAMIVHHPAAKYFSVRMP